MVTTPQPNKSSGRASTLKDVAERANVSISTASRVLSGQKTARSRLAEQVLVAASELDYRPNLAARSLRVARSRAIGVVFSRLDGQPVSDLLRGLESEARNLGYSLILADAGGDPVEFGALLGRLEERQVDGLVLYHPPATIGQAVKHLWEAGLPVIAVHQRPPGLGISLVTSRPTKSIELAVARLAALGHRSIGYMGTDSDIGDFRSRILTEGAARHEIAFSVLRIEEHEVGDFQAVATALARFREEFGGTALFTRYHSVPSVLNAIHDVDQSVPGDLSLISFGDGPWLLANRPQISAVTSKSVATIGEAAVQHLVEAIGGVPMERTYEVTEALWIERGSVGPAPTRRLFRGIGRLLTR